MTDKSGSFRKKKIYFSQVSNEALRDSKLSLKAKGLYALIQSYITIEDFTLYKGTLKNTCIEGDTSFDNAWNELKDMKYLKQYKLKGENGIFYYEYELLDKKETEIPDMDNQGVGNPQVDDALCGKVGIYNNTDLNNTDLNNTDLNNTDLNNTKDIIEQLWKMYPLKKGKKIATQKIKVLLKTYDFEQLQRCVERYKNYVTYRQKTDFKDLKFQNGSTFFNSGYVDYLDKNWKEESNGEINNSKEPTANIEEETEGDRLYKLAKEKLGDNPVDDIECDF